MNERYKQVEKEHQEFFDRLGTVLEEISSDAKKFLNPKNTVRALTLAAVLSGTLGGCSRPTENEQPPSVQRVIPDTPEATDNEAIGEPTEKTEIEKPATNSNTNQVEKTDETEKNSLYESIKTTVEKEIKTANPDVGYEIKDVKYYDQERLAVVGVVFDGEFALIYFMKNENGNFKLLTTYDPFDENQPDISEKIGIDKEKLDSILKAPPSNKKFEEVK